MPEISVIVPVYKAENYLSDCIDSLLSQTFADFEIILVEDGSPDNCGRLCDAYAAAHSCITVLHQENQGQAAARNHAMPLAKGKWICFVDSDDVIHPQMLELLHRAVEETGAPVAQCGFLEAESLPADFQRTRKASFEVRSMDEENLLSLYDADEYPAWIACAKLIRRDLIEGYPFREGRVYEDNEAVCRWLCRGGSLAGTREQLYFYRVNPEGTTKTAFRMKQLDYLWALESIIGFYGDMGFETLRRRFIDRYAEAVLSCCNGARYMLGRPDVVKRIERNTRAFLRREKIRLTKAQFEPLLDVTHPKLVKLYWPVAAAASTLRAHGVSGVAGKIAEYFRKGERQ